MILPNQEEGEEDSEETMDDDFDFDDFDDININDAGGGGVCGGGLGMGDGLDDNSEASVEERASARCLKNELAELAGISSVKLLES